MITRTMSLLVAIVLLLSGASTPAAVLSEQSTDDFITADHFSNNFWKLHDRLDERLGLSFEIVYLQDMFWNTRGGLRTKNSGEYPRLVGLYLELATRRAGLWENGTFFLSFEHHAGRSPTGRHVGDWQMLDNIDADHRDQVSEFWYRHTFFDEKLWLKLGKMEANLDFSYIETGLEFINSSAGLIPTVPMPSYPDQDWGAVVGVEPAPWLGCQFGMYQGDIDGSRSVGHTLDNLRGPMLIVEPWFKYELGGLPGSFNVGAWWSGRDFEAYYKHPSGRGHRGSSYGGYAFWQQVLWKENSADEQCAQGLGLFAQYGWAPKDRFEVEDYIGGGLRWQGLIPARDDDVMGLGVFHAYFSDRAGLKESAETAMEFFYKAQLTGWLAVQPDVQYIANPGGDNNHDAIAVGGRVEFVF